MIAKPALFAAMSLLVAAGAAAEEPDRAGAILLRCKICHTLDKGGRTMVGPNLHGVFGRKAGTAANFSASDAMKNSNIVWDDETLAKFLRDPKNSLPGNRMSFPGITDDAVLAEVIARLKKATQ
ncbi:MAG TPA: cytochrome c family protein [Stellaceae bacterium]|nr:cytochrome c family protein [Stellaceae bacterium]